MAETSKIPYLPPVWFMENLNRARRENGQPQLSMLDPLAMDLWGFLRSDILKPRPLIMLTGF